MTTAQDPDLVSTNKYFVNYPTDKYADTVVAIKEKPCRVVYMPAPLDGAYWEHGWPELREIMRNAVLWALKGILPFETTAQENVRVVLHRDKEKKIWVLHLHNQGVNNQYSVGFDCSLLWDKPQGIGHSHPVRVAFKTAPFLITLNTIKSNRLSARSLTSNEVLLEKRGGRWVLKHPGLSEYDAIVLKEGE